MTSIAPTLNHSLENVLSQPAKPAKKVSQMHCVAITGGKGGVGKSNLSVNLALELGALGSRTTLLDADFGLGNADLLCGVTPKFHLGHVIAGFADLRGISISLSENVTLIPSGNGIEELANFTLAKHSSLLKNLQAMEANHDYMLIDTAAGIGKNVLSVLAAATEIVVVTTPEPTAIVDAYATIKAILRENPAKPISLVVNNVVGVGDAEQVFQHISFTVNNFLNHKVDFLGMIPQDAQLSEAVRQQIPVVRHAPGCPASRAVRLIAGQLHNRARKGFAFQPQSFWDTLTGTV